MNRHDVFDMLFIALACVGFYVLGRYDESLDYQGKVHRFSTTIQCPDEDNLSMKTLDLEKGEVRCQYFQKTNRT